MAPDHQPTNAAAPDGGELSPPIDTATAMSAMVPRFSLGQMQIGLWVLRGFHVLMLYCVVAGLINSGASVNAAKTQLEKDAGGVGMIFGLMILLVIWAAGAKIINSIRKAF